MQFQWIKTLLCAASIGYSGVVHGFQSTASRASAVTRFGGPWNLGTLNGHHRSAHHLGSSNDASRRVAASRSMGFLAAERVGDSDPAIRRDDDLFDAKQTFLLVGGQSTLIGIAAILAKIFDIPNLGFGPHIDLGLASLQQGLVMALPMGALAVVLDAFEDKVPALQDVTKATQKSILGLMGGSFKPFWGMLIAIALGFAAGFGEEMLFRGVLQYSLAAKVGTAGSLVIASVIFGALHAVTPLYAVLAGIASLYFGYLYLAFGNLAIPIFAHALYDVGALYYAHWTVSKLSVEEKSKLFS